jgi:hypothetical protein
VNLLGIGLTHLGAGDFAQRLHLDAERADGPGDPGLHGLLFLQLRGGFARQAYPGAIDGCDFVGEAEALQPVAVCAEGVGLDQLRTGQQVLLMNAADQVGIGEVQLVVTAVDEDASVVEDRAHGSIAEDGAGVEECL